MVASVLLPRPGPGKFYTHEPVKFSAFRKVSSCYLLIHLRSTDRVHLALAPYTSTN